MARHLAFLDLNKDELYWATLEPFLLSRGYKLRPRYEPGWVGSWTYNGKYFSRCEDSKINWPWNVIDAIRTKDNVKVALKLVPTFTEQIPIALYLSSPVLLSDPRNRTIRFSDVIPLPHTDRRALLVMPFLREFDDPRFRYLGECIEVFRQMLQGIEFMHEQNIAHRDACGGNLMMDTTRLIPGGFHHVVRNSADGVNWRGSKFVKRSRLSVSPVDYYFIDFGLSTRFLDRSTPPLVTGTAGQNRTVPELSATIPYDPFKVDIYQLGGVIKELVEEYHGLDLFKSLMMAMSRPDPLMRPTASEALQQFENIVLKLTRRDMKARVLPYKNRLRIKLMRKLRNLVPLQQSPPLPQPPPANKKTE